MFKSQDTKDWVPATTDIYLESEVDSLESNSVRSDKVPKVHWQQEKSKAASVLEDNFIYAQNGSKIFFVNLSHVRKST